MKKLHLICNAHLDPVWMWDWHEGAAAALATYYSAIELASEYDYIFCHNEVILYEYIEKYAPELFTKIQALVKEGKWHIMGGWYLQPDCMLPQGESFLRQITLGREYFAEKLGSRPSVAVNFDAFGHTRGLVQILAKSGFDGYICCRPFPADFPLENNLFWWQGYDGSKIKALRIPDITTYCSGLGTAKADILRKAEDFAGEEVGLALWGVGNHGGGASRKDLSDILLLQDEKKGEWEIIHSTPEAYFSEVTPRVTHAGALPCFIKSYTSIHSLKEAHAQLEDCLYSTERACAVAELAGGYTYPIAPFREAERMLCTSEFHDVLSGTCTEEGEKSTLQKISYAKELLRQEFLKAFHSLACKYEEAKEGKNPFILFNFQPYDREEVVETEVLIPDSIVSDVEGYKITVYQDGKIIPSQVIKELSNINYDRRKRIAYRCALSALGTARVDVTWERAVKEAKRSLPSGDILYVDRVKQVKINRKTGLIDSFIVEGKEYLSDGAFQPVLFEDNADPWGWYMTKLGKNERLFALDERAEGVFKGLQAVKIVEDGEVLTEVESLFYHGNSSIRLSYKIYKDLPYIDVSAYVLWNEQNGGLKFKIATAAEGDYFGQVAYGTEEYAADGGENIAQRFVGVQTGEKCLSVYSSGVYGNSKQGKDLYLTALNGSAYCAHPIGDRPLVDDSRFLGYIEQGKHTFSFRMSVNAREECERLSQEFVNPSYSVNMYPHGNGEVASSPITISDNDVVLTACKRKKSGGYILRLMNNCARDKVCTLRVKEHSIDLQFKPFVFITCVYDGQGLREEADASVY